MNAARSLLLIFPLLTAHIVAEEPLFPDDIDVGIRPIAEDASVKWDYPIAYVRARREGDEIHKRFTPISPRPSPPSQART